MRWTVAIALAAALGCSKRDKQDSEEPTKTGAGQGGSDTGSDVGSTGADIGPDQDRPPPPRGPLRWMTDEKAALARAAETKRPVFIDFGAQWCEPCRLYEERVFTDPDVIARLSGMVLIRFDVTAQTPADEAAQQRYKATTLPMLIGLSAAGDEKVRISELLEPEAFVAALARLE